MAKTYVQTKLEETARDRYQFLLPEDSSLIPSQVVNRTFDPRANRVETIIFSLDRRVLSITEDNANYKVLGGGTKDGVEIEEIELFPTQDALDKGFDGGDVEVLYNFYNNIFSSTRDIPKFYIKEISGDRREIVALSLDLPRQEIVEGVNLYKRLLEESETFQELLIRFEDTSVLSCINLDTVEVEGEIGIKLRLYTPLPGDVQVKTLFSVEEPLSDGVIFRITEEVDIPEPVEEITPLRGPNFWIKIAEDTSESSELVSLSDILAADTSSVQGKLLRKIKENSVDLGIDYSKPSEFIHFSSLVERLKVYEFKKDLILDLQNTIDTANIPTVQKQKLEKKVLSILENFDHFEEYLWENEVPVDQELKDLAQAYDNLNSNRLINTVPVFLREDPRNLAYLLFVDMIGHLFDNVWIYIKAIENRYNTDNRLDIGLSKDLLVDAIKSFGVSLKGNKESVDSLFKFYSGQTPVTDLPESVSIIEKDITEGTDLSGSLPFDKERYVKEVYKRIYHNIPLLLKTKGTEKGLRTLINCFGIPSDILEIKVKTSSGILTETNSTGSLDRINTQPSTTLGTTLSATVKIEEIQELPGTENYIEVGFSPTDLVNKDIVESGSIENIDQVVGDPRNRYLSRYPELDLEVRRLSNTENGINVKAFLRIVEFYNNSLFKNLAQFVDVTTQTGIGFIIKPSLLNRSKHPEVRVTWKGTPKTNPEEIDILDLEYILDTIFSGKIKVGKIVGGDGGGFGQVDKPGLIDKYRTGFIENVPLPGGGFSDTYKIGPGEEERNYPNFTGEFKGSTLKVTEGDLNDENPFKRINLIPFEFNLRGLLEVPPADCRLFVEVIDCGVSIEVISPELSFLQK